MAAAIPEKAHRPWIYVEGDVERGSRHTVSFHRTKINLLDKCKLLK